MGMQRSKVGSRCAIDLHSSFSPGKYRGGAALSVGVLEAERHFRKVVGYRAIARLDAALRAHDAALDNRKQAA